MQNYFLKADIQYSAVHQLPIELTDLRCEFFWDWVVNLRLIFVNFALHYPPSQACYFRGADKKAYRKAERLTYFRLAATNAKSGP